MSKFYIVFSVSLALVQTWSFSFEPMKTNNLTLAVLSYVQQNCPTLQLLIQALNVNKNYQIKWYGQGRCRRLPWISFQLSVLLKLFIHMTSSNSLKKCAHRIVSNSLFLREATCCYNSLWKFFVTKPINYKDVFVNSLFTSIFRLGNALVLEPFLWLLI